MKINDGLKEIKNDDEEESKFKFKNIPKANDTEFDLGPYKASKRFQPNSK